MAVTAKQFALLTFLAVPVIAYGYRFHIPKNLFTQGYTASSVPEGVREIGGTEDLPELAHNEFEAANRPRRRTRRAVSRAPLSVESDLTGEIHDMFHMYWPGDGRNDSNILLLARNKRGQSTSNVYLSTNSGGNWTKINSRLRLRSRSLAVIDQIFVSKANPRLCILTDVVNKHIFVTTDFQQFTSYVILWTPSFVAFHPTNDMRILGYDKSQKKLYLSVDRGQTFLLLGDNVKTFWWGIPEIDEEGVVFVERLKSSASNSQTKAEKINTAVQGNPVTLLIDYVDEFEVMGKYQFATQKKPGGKMNLKVSYKRGPFIDTRFPVTESNRDYFLFNIEDDQVFIVINHQKNLSSMYLSDIGGVNYVVSLERVLYHNPYTDVSSPWLRTVVPYAFVDVRKVLSMRGVYIATQLTPGPVGRRHLLSLITYNKGGSWGRIRSPTRDVYGSPIYCYLPSCSLHFNLLYGSVYRISPSENLLSTKSAPGLVMALGVASTNLKIHPDVFVSTDGGVNWKRALRGKHQYAFGDHGGVLIAVLYRRYTYTFKYSTNGGNNWTEVAFTSSSKKVLVHDVFTQKKEKLPVFLIYGSIVVNGKKIWKIFRINLTSVLGNPCTANDSMTWIPSDLRAGLDRCILGRQVEYQIRNWTRTCFLGKEYVKVLNTSSCPCRSVDFECDFGFQRNSSDLGCTPVPGEDLDNDLIPDRCPEGHFYMRSRGYRKIPGDGCIGGEATNLLPVTTPCPIKDLGGLTITASIQMKPLGVETNVPVTFTAGVAKGYLANIVFGWDFGDGSKANGTGASAKQQVHSFPKPGHYVVVVTATNTRSILVGRLGIDVADRLLNNKVSLMFSPLNPTINQQITFIAGLQDYTREAAAHVTYKWLVGNKAVQQGWRPVLKYTFQKSADYLVTVQVSNIVNTVANSTTVTVLKDIRPLRVKAAALGSTSVSVTWQSPQEAARYVLGFKIYTSENRRTGFKLSARVDNTHLNGAVYSLTPASTYFFKVMAFTRVENGDFSDVVSATTNSSVPGVPQNLRAYPISTTAIRLQWDPPQNAKQGIQYYTIHWWSSIDTSVVSVTVGGKVLFKDFVKRRPNTKYFFQVFATSVIGAGLVTKTVYARTNISIPVLPPRNLQQLSDNGTCVIMSWDAPYISQFDTRSFPAKGYTVFVDGKKIKSTGYKRATLCGFSPGTKHTIQVLAYSVAGNGPKATKNITIITLEPTAPRNVVAVVKSSQIILLTWEHPVTIGGRLLNYAVYQMRPIVWRWPKKVFGETRLELTHLEPYSKYEFTVAANNSAGLSPRSSIVAATTSEALPDAPKYVTTEVVKPESATILLRWSPPEHPNGVITNFKITWSKTDVKDINYQRKETYVVGNKLEYTFMHLFSATEYSFSVGSKNGAGESLSNSIPTREYTQPAIHGTKRLHIEFAGAEDTAGKTFESDFINAVSSKVAINSERLAALDVREAVLEFDVLPKFKGYAKSIEQITVELNKTFAVGSARTVAGSLRVIKKYNGITPSKTPSSAGPSVVPGAVGALKSDPGNERSTLALAIAVPATLIGLALLAGLIFFYRKYKTLEQHYSHMSGIYRAQDDEMNIVYPADMADETRKRLNLDDHHYGTSRTEGEMNWAPAKSPPPPTNIESTYPHDMIMESERKSKKKKYHKEEEKIPLGEHDELAMV